MTKIKIYQKEGKYHSQDEHLYGTKKDQAYWKEGKAYWKEYKISVGQVKQG